MKIIIKESQYKFLNEQSNFWGEVTSTVKGLIKNSWKVNPLSISYYFVKLAMSVLGVDGIKKVRLIFPQSNWEINAVNFMKSLGIVTGVYESLDDAIKYCKTLSSKGVKVEEFVIGSHGKAGNLLMTKASKYGYHFNTSFLTSFKPLISQNTKVFFTACHGADYLLLLKNAADELGVTTYGSQGIYNYVTNESEKGFYWCSTKPTKKFDITNNETLPTYKINYNTITDIWIPNLDKNEIDAIVTIDPKLFGINFSPKKLHLTSDEYSKTINYDKNGEPIEAYSFNLDALDLLDEKKYRELSDKGIKGLYVSEYFSKTIFNNIKNGRVKIEFVTKNGLINLTSLKPLNSKSKNDVTNDYLLKNKICGKMSSSPISWL
jgi:hypothetical protein